jgi:hypothetical protein
MHLHAITLAVASILAVTNTSVAAAACASDNATPLRLLQHGS